MKKSILILSAITLFTLAGCGPSKGNDEPTNPDPILPEPPATVTTNYTVEEFMNKIDSLVAAVPTTKTDLGLKTEFLEQARFDYDIEGNKSYVILHKHTIGGIYVQGDLVKINEDDTNGQKYTTLDAEGKESSTQKTISETHETLHRQLKDPFAHFVSTGEYTVANNPEDPDRKNGKYPMNYEYKLTHDDAVFNQNTKIYLGYTREERTKYLLNSFKQVEKINIGVEHKISSVLDKTTNEEIFTVNTLQNFKNVENYKEQNLTMTATFTVKNNLVENLTQSLKQDAILSGGTVMKVKQDYTIDYVDCPTLTFPTIAPEVVEIDEGKSIEPVGVFPFGFNYHDSNE